MGAAISTGSILPELAGELAHLADTLLQLAAPQQATPRSKLRSASELAERMISFRRRRDGLFPPELFADPAWDILLDLFVADTRKKRLSVSAVCLGAAVPPTTALRHIKLMTDSDMLERQHDTQDGRKVYLSLSEKTLDTMKYLLNSELSRQRP